MDAQCTTLIITVGITLNIAVEIIMNVITSVMVVSRMLEFMRKERCGMMNEYDDYCYECRGYGDDCYYDEESDDLVYACDDCVFNEDNWVDGYWKDDI